MKTAGAVLALLLATACASSPAASRPRAATGSAPFGAAPAARHEVRVELDTKAAREILGSLSRPKFEPTDVKVLEDMLPIRLAIEDSGRSSEIFERDFAAAFSAENQTAVFDFASIRKDRDRWQVLLEMVSSHKEDIEHASESRAIALLPGDRAISARVASYVSFGLAGLADHLLVATPNGPPAVIVDLARALGDVENQPPDVQTGRVVSLISGETFRIAWAVYCGGSPNWKRAAPQLGSLEPLVRMVAEGGPVALFGIEDSFFPLSTWLKEPMHRALNDLDRMAERLVESEKDLDVRVSVAAEVKRPDFQRRVASPAGAYMEDGILQAFGIDALRAALAEGPVAFFQAYVRAAHQNKDLPPLAKVIEERLAMPPTAPAR